MEDLNKYTENEQMGTTSSAFITDVTNIVRDVKKYLMSVQEFQSPTYTQVQDTKFMIENYGAVTQANSKVLDYIRECEFKITICKEAMNSIELNTVLNQRIHGQLKNLHNSLKNLLDPLYTEEKRMDRILRFYEKTYNTFM